MTRTFLYRMPLWMGAVGLGASLTISVAIGYDLAEFGFGIVDDDFILYPWVSVLVLSLLFLLFAYLTAGFVFSVSRDLNGPFSIVLDEYSIVAFKTRIQRKVLRIPHASIRRLYTVHARGQEFLVIKTTVDEIRLSSSGFDSRQTYEEFKEIFFGIVAVKSPMALPNRE